jgi:NhaA family Na+:H+ antiporter
MLHSGIHPTIAGVILAMTVPMKLHNSPLKRLMHILHPWVNYLILPIFAFSNAGIRLINISSDMLLAPLTIAVMISLIAGKTFGVFLSSWLCIKMKFAELPPSLKFSQLFGVSIITGIGFTISLFIAQLAFSDPTFHMQAKIGVMAGSLFSAVIGYIVLVMVSERERN